MSYPPTGTDRANGLDGNPGTPSPPGTVEKQPSQEFLEEDPSSPQIELGEHATYVHRIKVDYINGQAILLATPRGTILTDSQGNQYKVLTCQLDYQKGDYCIISTTVEALQVPPEDEYHVETVEFNPSIFLHPQYQTVVNYSAQNQNSTHLVTGPEIIGWINNAVNLPAQTSQGEYLNQLTSFNITDSDVLDLALELVQKLQRGEDTYYLSGWRVYWSQFFNLPQGLNPGGYIEDPVDFGGLPAYFWSDDGTPSGNNTLLDTAVEINPLFYENGISWLRQADTLEYQRVWFKIIHSWIGGPLGTWDDDLYASNPPIVN